MSYKMSYKANTDILKHYLKQAVAAHGDAVAEIEDACDSLAEQMDAINQRLLQLESATRRAAELASCLANGIQPD